MLRVLSIHMWFLLKLTGDKNIVNYKNLNLFWNYFLYLEYLKNLFFRLSATFEGEYHPV